MKPIHTVIAALCLSLGVLGTPQAAAALAKVIPANACQSVNDSLINIARGATDLGSVSGPPVFSCSLLRDNTTNTNGLSALQLRVEKADTQTRLCTAYVVDGYGNLLKSVDRTVSGAGIRTFDWGTSLNVSSSNGATYRIQCVLGADDFAKNVYWNEPTPGTGLDRKIFPANYCKTGFGSYQMVRTATQLVGSVPDGSGRYLMVCPLLRDTFSTSKGLQGLKMRLYIDNPAESNCEGIVADSHSNYVKSVTKAANGSGYVTFDWGTSLNVVNTRAHYGIECGLTTSDAVYSIEYAE